MKKWAWVIAAFFVVQSLVVHGQYYQSEINLTADILLVEADSLLKAKDYSTSKATYEEAIKAYSRNRPSSNLRQNLFYLELKSFECIIGNKDKTTAFAKVDSIGSLIDQEFGEESVLSGYATFLKGRSSTTYDDAYKYYTRAAEIREKTLPKGHIDIVLSTEKVAMANGVLKNKEAALLYSKQFLELAKKSESIDSAIIIRAYSNLAGHYYNDQLYDAAKLYFDTTYQLAIKHLPAEHKYVKVATSNMGIISGSLGETENQLYYTNKTIQLNQPKEGEVGHTTLVSSYTSLGYIYFLKNDFVKSRLYLDTVRAILDEYPEPSYPHEILYCIRASNLERNVTRRIEYLEKALGYLDVYQYAPISHETSIYNNLAVAYSTLGVEDKRKVYLEKSLDLQLTKSPNYNKGISNTLVNLAAYHIDNGNYERALALNSDSFRYRAKGNNVGLFYEPINWFQLINIQVKTDALTQAQSSLDSAYLAIKKLELDSLHFHWGTWHLKKSTVEFHLNSLDSALHHIDLALAIQKDDIGFGAINQIEARETKYEILVALGKGQQAKEFLSHSLSEVGVINEGEHWNIESTMRFNLWKAFSLYQLYQRDFLDEMAPSEAMSFIKVGSRLIGNIRTYFIDNIAEVEFYESIKSYSTNSIEYLYQSCLSEDSEVKKKMLFDLIIQNRDIRTSKGLQSQFESKKKKEINAYIVKSNMLYDQLTALKNEGAIDSTYRSAREALLSFEKNKVNHFLKKSKSENQEGLVDFNHFESFSSSLGEAQGIIYFMSESSLYQVNVCNGDLSIEKFPLEKIDQLIFSLTPLLTDWSSRSDESFEANSTLFVTTLDTLSQILLPEKCSTSDMIIFPDGILLNLPFDILLTASPSKSWSFRDLPYLIRQKRISYASTIDQLSKPLASKSSNKSYLGVAPLYSQVDSTGELRSSQSALYYNQLEVSQAQKAIKGGRSVLGEKATKATFLSELEGVDWLHLAAHAKFDQVITYLSYLSFAGQDSFDNKLHAYEIANLDLPIDLAVLSACETNKGSSKNGLGLLGIARAFQIAGCNNLVITNWLVDDAASQAVITDMFHQKIAGKSTPDALRNAKLQYLENASEALAHPIYWAGFNYYGSITYENNSLSYWWLCIPLFFLFTYLFRKLFK